MREGFGVRLDDRPLRLPDGSLLICARRKLAEAMAEEWQLAGGGMGGVFDHEALPLTRLFGMMVQDLDAGTGRTIEALLRFASNDLLCYRAARPPALAALQAVRWQPWLEWVADRHDARLLVTEGVMPVAQPKAAIDALRVVAIRLSPARLTGLRLAVPALGSLVLGMALAERRLAAMEAFALSRLDEEFQSAQWGVDGGSAACSASLRGDVMLGARWMELADD